MILIICQNVKLLIAGKCYNYEITENTKGRIFGSTYLSRSVIMMRVKNDNVIRCDYPFYQSFMIRLVVKVRAEVATVFHVEVILLLALVVYGGAFEIMDVSNDYKKIAKIMEIMEKVQRDRLKLNNIHSYNNALFSLHDTEHIDVRGDLLGFVMFIYTVISTLIDGNIITVVFVDYNPDLDYSTNVTIREGIIRKAGKEGDKVKQLRLEKDLIDLKDRSSSIDLIKLQNLSEPTEKIYSVIVPLYSVIRVICVF
jgi:hypothetical protein